jgi:hypothetical protein
MRNTTDKCTHKYVNLLHYKQCIYLYAFVDRISHNKYQCLIMNHLILRNNIQEIPCVGIASEFKEISDFRPIFR